mmetsp:Transcript_20789/g.32568  ORF Transcript_20789/g.32568 Transcript_20789/m.32568 type:complete len:201 (+) Transcript_20789:67-669(+)
MPPMATSGMSSLNSGISTHPSPYKMKNMSNDAANALNKHAPVFTPTKNNNNATISSTPTKNSNVDNAACGEEICVAALWWSREMMQHDLHHSEVSAFENALREQLLRRCEGHWYPAEPLRGSGHRCVINDFSVDPLLVKAAEASRIRNISSRLPRAQLWLNPGSVKVKLENYPYPKSLYNAQDSQSSNSGASGSEDESEQ